VNRQDRDEGINSVAVESTVDRPDGISGIKYNERTAMQSPSLTCPYCGREIELSQALTHSIEEKLSRQLVGRLQKEVQEMEAAALERAKVEYTPELEELRKRIEEKEKKLKESAAVELQLRQTKSA